MKSVLFQKLKAFGGDWFMFYCPHCGRVLDTGLKSDHCESCDEKVDWENKKEY